MFPNADTRFWLIDITQKNKYKDSLMLTGEIRNQVDRIWDTFWTGGISNPLEVIEQLTYLLFIKRLDELHTVRESKANMLGTPIADPIFGLDQQNLRWSHFKNFDPEKLYNTIADEVFPFMKNMGADESAFAKHMKDARFMLPPEKAGPNCCAKRAISPPTAAKTSRLNPP